MCEYGWRFAGSDVNKGSIDWAEENIIRKNLYLKDHTIDRGGSIRYQKDSSLVLEGVIY
jgi:23S rRNA A1618 N6-methylase RlmF